MNKILVKNIIICSVVFIIVIIFLNWLVKSGQADRSKNQAENFIPYYQQLLSQCGNEKPVYDCCFSSVSYMATNNLKTAGISCEPGFKLNTFTCQGSYRWCEMIR